MKKNKKKVEPVWIKYEEPIDTQFNWDIVIASVAITLGIILVYNWGEYMFNEHVKQEESQQKLTFRDGQYETIQNIYRSNRFKTEDEKQNCSLSAQGK